MEDRRRERVKLTSVDETVVDSNSDEGDVFWVAFDTVLQKVEVQEGDQSVGLPYFEENWKLGEAHSDDLEGLITVRVMGDDSLDAMMKGIECIIEYLKRSVEEFREKRRQEIECLERILNTVSYKR